MLALGILGCFLVTGHDRGDVAVRVVDDGGAPVANAQVRLQGVPGKVYTDEEGLAWFRDVRPVSYALEVDGNPAGVFAPGAGRVTVPRGAVGGVTVALARVETREVHRPDRGGSIAVLGAGALVFDDGAWGAGLAPVAVAHAFARPGAGTVPAPFVAPAREQDDPVPLAIRGAAWLAADPTDCGDGRCRLGVPLDPALGGAQPHHVVRFDEGAGFWERVGDATSTPGGTWVEGEIDGAGWWALASDVPLGCASGFVSDAGAGFEVVWRSAVHAVRGVGWTDRRGEFCVPAPAGEDGELLVFGADAEGVVRTGAAAVDGGDGDAGTCIGCADVGAVRVTKGLPAPSLPGACPLDRFQPVLDLGPKLYWRFDEVDGTHGRDEAGWGNEATLGRLAWDYESVADDGIPAPMFLASTDSHVLLPVFDEMGTDEITVSLWFKSVYTRRELLSYAAPEPDPSDGANAAVCATDELRIQLSPDEDPDEQDTDEKIKVEVSDHLAGVAVPPDLPGLPGGTVGGWQHLAVVVDGTGGLVQVFADGVATTAPFPIEYTSTDLCPEGPHETGEDVGPVSVAPGGRLYLGQQQDVEPELTAPQALLGLLDEVAIYDRLLTTEEIAALARATCSETPLGCDGVDGDQDGRVDEHVVGQDPACAAPDCAEIAATGSWIGDGPYHLLLDGDPTRATCVQVADGFEEVLCGDGDLVPPFETCDGDPACDGCAIVVPGAQDCFDVLGTYGYGLDGPYVVGQVSADGGPTQRVRCLMSAHGGGFTLVHSHGQAGAPFGDPGDATTYNSSVGYFDVFDAPEGDAKPGVNYDGDPFALAYSILGQLPTFEGPDGYDFVLSYPKDGGTYAWRQDESPLDTTPGVDFRFVEIELPPDSNFRGLRHGLIGTSTPNALATGEGTPPCPWPTGCPRALLDGADTLDPLLRSEPWFSVGAYVWTYDPTKAYPAWGDPELTPDGSVAKVELWVRPATGPLP